MSQTPHYDFIIAGMGCAGLSLAMELKNSSLVFSKVLLIDKDLKNKNDRTWCFWTKENNNWFDAIVYHRWDKFTFKSNELEKTFDLAPYQYLMIKGIDFYDYCLTHLKSDARFEIVTDNILSISSLPNVATLQTPTHTFNAHYIFNSAFRKLSVKAHHINYVQHFKGWIIETEKESFDTECPVFMDFNVDQFNDCRFVYTIPLSSTRALVEYTGFSPNIISDEEYDNELVKYIQHQQNITSYKILETEKGQIPMVESEFVNPYGNRVVNIGTAGGSSKPSTGYTFYFIQKQVQDIVQQLLLQKNQLHIPTRNARFLLYDKVLLEVLNKKQLSAQAVFTNLFKNNKITHLLAFLNEESTLVQDIQIMNSVPKTHFIKAFLKKIIN